MIILKCGICGNVVELIRECNSPVTCCGQDMVELVPGTSDGSHEKHIPIVTHSGQKVYVMVGELAHPMTEAHFIEWIALETTYGIHRFYLKPDQKPIAEFMLDKEEKLLGTYAYCNLHGLWKAW